MLPKKRFDDHEGLIPSFYLHNLTKPTFHSVTEGQVGEVAVVAVDFEHFHNALCRNSHGCWDIDYKKEGE